MFKQFGSRFRHRYQKMNRILKLRSEYRPEGMTFPDQAPIAEAACENSVDDINDVVADRLVRDDSLDQLTQRCPELDRRRKCYFSLYRFRPARFSILRFPFI